MATSLLTGIEATHLLGYAASVALVALVVGGRAAGGEGALARCVTDGLLLVSVACTVHGALLGATAFALLNAAAATYAVSLMIRPPRRRMLVGLPVTGASPHGAVLASMHAEIARIHADRERALAVMATLG